MNALVAFIKNKRFIDGSDAGTGKTYSAALYTQWAIETYKLPVIWVQPKSLITKNKDEIIRFTDIKADQIVIVEGDKLRRDRCLNPGKDVYLMTADTLKIHLPKVTELLSCLIIVDEVHLLYGQPNSQRTQALFAIMNRTERFLAMSGTMVAGKYITLYPTIKIVEPRYYFNIDHFKQVHCIVDYYGNVLGYKEGERLKEMLAKHSVRTSFEEAYGKEAKVIIRERIELSSEQLKVYERLEKEALIELEDSFINADLPGPRAIRARQILACPEIFDPKCPANRDEHLSIHFEEPGPVVIFSTFTGEQERTLKLAFKTGRRAAVMNGSTSAKERARISQDYIDDRLDTLIVSPAVGGVGFNWGRTERMYFLSMSYQDSDFIQNYRRAIRGERKEALLIYLMTYKCAVEERVLAIIERKSREAYVVDPTREVFKFG